MTPKPHSATSSRTLLRVACVAVLLSTAISLWPVSAGAEIDCYGSLQAYRQDPNMRGYNCDCRNGANSMPVCTSSSSKGASTHGHSQGLSSKNAMKLQIMQSVLDSAANAFIRWINEPAKPAHTGPSPAQLAAQREKLEREKAEWRAKVQKQITEMESEYAQQERQKVDASKTRLLAGMKGLGDSPAASRSHALQQLRCKAYWGMKAARASSAEDAAQFSRFAENPDAAALAECDRALPQPPMPSAADDFRADLYGTMVAEINQRLPLIEQAKAKQREADAQFADRQQRVDELKARQEAVASTGEKQAEDDLLAAAMQELAAAETLKSEADAGVMKLQLEIEALKEVEDIAANTNSSSDRKGLVP